MSATFITTPINIDFFKNVEINSSQVNFCKMIQITYYFWKEGGDMTWNV